MDEKEFEQFQKEADELFDEIDNLEDDAVDKMESDFDAFIAKLLVISTATNLTLREKKKHINDETKKMFDKINEFSTSFTQRVLEKSNNNAEELAKLIGVENVQKLSETQLNETIKNFSEEVTINLKGMATKFKGQADKNAVQKKRELAKEEAGYKDGRQRAATSANKKRLTAVNGLTTRTGGKISVRNSLRLAIGDVLFRGDSDVLEATWLKNGITRVVHVSVIDNRTTQICRSLDGTVRILGEDQLPPMHPNCRSRVYPII